jgi:hypothetical protein
VAVCGLYVCVYDVPVCVVFGYVLYFFPFKKSPKTECRLDSGADYIREYMVFSQLPATRSPASTLNSFLCHRDPFILTHHIAENLSLFPPPVPRLILSKSTAVPPHAMTAYKEEDVQHH